MIISGACASGNKSTACVYVCERGGKVWVWVCIINTEIVPYLIKTFLGNPFSHYPGISLYFVPFQRRREIIFVSMKIDPSVPDYTGILGSNLGLTVFTS